MATIQDDPQVPVEEEKQTMYHVESDSNHSGVPKENDANAVLASFSARQERHLVRRIDFKLIPMAGALYLVSLLDRTNLGAARIAGMTEELELEQGGVDRYSVIALVFFITYTLFQPPATILTRIVGPRLFLPSICFAWGTVVIGFGFVESWVTLVPLRLLLGILEAGMFPGIVYLLSTWYLRVEVGKRYAAFWVFGVLTNAFGGILAFGLMQMDGLSGLTGWRWIFIVEGIITCLIGILGYLFLLGFPDSNPFSLAGGRFLNDHELRYVLARVEKDRGDSTIEKFVFSKWLRGGADFKIWLFAFSFMSTTAVGYALIYFMPVILVGDMGFSIGEAQCLVAPPAIFAGIVMVIFSWFSDKYQQRGIFVVTYATMSIVGLFITGFSANVGARYFGLFLAAAGSNGNIPMLMTWQANNIRGQWKRAFCSATLVGFGGIGGIVGSTVFRQQDEPRFLPGLLTCAGLSVAIAVIGLGLMGYFSTQNKQQEKGKVLEELENFRYII